MNKKNREIAMYILGGLIVIGFFSLLYLLIFTPIPINNIDIMNIVIGALIGSFTTVVGYFYGSSLGSKEKNDIFTGQKK
jgi:heme O synthase-like polyprenyltransferase